MVSGEIIASTKKSVKKFILPLIKVIAKTGLGPNFFTFFSFVFGLLSVYFLFKSFWLFSLFSIIAILFDVIDGNLARYLKKESKLGFYLDQGNDRTINFLLLLKYCFIYNTYWFVILLYLVHYVLFFLFNLKSVIYVRTFLVIFLIAGSYFEFFVKGFNYHLVFHFGVIFTAILLSLGIALQLNEFILKKNKKGNKKR